MSVGLRSREKASYGGVAHANLDTLVDVISLQLKEIVEKRWGKEDVKSQVTNLGLQCAKDRFKDWKCLPSQLQAHSIVMKLHGRLQPVRSMLLSQQAEQASVAKAESGEASV